MKNDYKYHRELRRIRDDLINMKKEIVKENASIGGEKIAEYGEKIVEETKDLIDKGFNESMGKDKITQVQLFWMIFIPAIIFVLIFGSIGWHMSELNSKILDLEDEVFIKREYILRKDVNHAQRTN